MRSFLLAASALLGLVAAGKPSSLPTTVPATTATPSCNPQACPATYQPICATNGGTYVNQCQLDAAHCKNSSVVAAPGPKGECKKTPKTRPVILLVGDSITRRSFDPNLGGWGVRLAYDYSPVIDVINRGMGGYTTKWMLEFGMTDLLTSIRKYEPSLITLWLGTNDGGVNLTYTVPNEQFRFYYPKLLHTIQKAAPKAKILLIAPPPVKDETYSASIKERVAIVLDIAKKEKLDVVNLYDTMMTSFPTAADREALWVDGIHLTQVGNNAAYQAIKPKIASIMPPSFFTTLQEPTPEELRTYA